MEKLLEKLGARIVPNRHPELFSGEMWQLQRLGLDYAMEPNTKVVEWLIIGEITEALRERGWNYFACTFFPGGTVGLYCMNYNDDTLEPTFSADTLLDCYIKAGEELL